jgi:hypothetical protein
MSAVHDPLPPEVHCTPELAELFDDWLEDHNERVRGGYVARPCTHMFVAFLAGRESHEVDRRRTLTQESARAIALFNSFSGA